MDMLTGIIIVVSFFLLALVTIVFSVVEYRSRQDLLSFIDAQMQIHREVQSELLDRIQSTSFAELKNAEVVLHKVKTAKVEYEDRYEPA